METLKKMVDNAEPLADIFVRIEQLYKCGKISEQQRENLAKNIKNKYERKLKNVRI